MNFALDEDHLALKQSAARFLDEEIALDALLKPGARVADANYPGNWEKIAAMGWQGIVIPEIYGGLGLSCIDLAMVLAEMGRTLAPSPFLGNLMGTWALLRLGTEEQKRRLLPGVAAGTTRLALAVADTSGETDRDSTEATAERSPAGHLLTGTRSFVIDAGDADWLIVATHDARIGRRAFFLVNARQRGVGADIVDWRDLTRQVSDIRLSDAAGEVMAPHTAADWEWIRDRILFALAAECAAGTQQILSMTADYAKERVAFGKPIGAYQSIKHSLADMLGQSECANVAVLYAAWALSEEAPQASLAAAMAKAYATDAYVNCAHRSIQIFGAIGFTWEMKNHLYLKRAHANAELFGNARSHRSRVIDLAQQAAA
ncbi:MAG: acyl-CoA dehydrogenase family protein [Rhizomicrobium sp.]|jgi:alkylation response protein AidB-like acyl-CoA dehydrogenase